MIDQNFKIILEPIQVANAEIIKAIMIKYVKPGSIIVTDGALYYNFFEQCRWKHQFCIHSNKETKNKGGFSTDKIEKEWGIIDKNLLFRNSYEEFKNWIQLYENAKNNNMDQFDFSNYLVGKYLNEKREIEFDYYKCEDNIIPDMISKYIKKNIKSPKTEEQKKEYAVYREKRWDKWLMKKK